MSFIAELLALMIGEALFEQIARWLEPIYSRFNVLIVCISWIFLPIAEWYAFRIVQRGPSPVQWSIAVLLALGWPIFAVISTVIWFHFRQNNSGPAA